MYIKKDSLVLRIIFYNDIAIILISTILALVFSIIVFDGMEKRLLDRAREKTNLLSKAYTIEIKTSKDELFNSTILAFNFIDSNFIDKNSNALANVIMNKLLEDKQAKYRSVLLNIVSSNGFILGDATNDKKLKRDLYNVETIDTVKKNVKNNDFYFLKVNNKIYVRIVQAFRGYSEDTKKYIVLTMPLENYSSKNIENFIELEKEERYFVLSDDFYSFGNLEFNKKSKFLNKMQKKLNEHNLDYRYKYDQKNINNIEYLISLKNILDPNGEVIGYFGSAISKTNFLAIKYMVTTIIVAIVLIAIAISTTLCSQFFTKLLAPLYILADKTQRFGIEAYDVSIEEKGIFEIRTLINAFMTMAKRIEKKDKEIKENYDNLQKNLDRIIAIEKILMGVDVENNFNLAIKGLLKALTSEIGLAYSRAIYLEFNEEENSLDAKYMEINTSVATKIEKDKELFYGFKFQIEDIKKLLALLRVKYDETSLLWKAIKESKVIYKNEKGYKFNFGNDLFKAIGISNFMILPIANANFNRGVILIDYFSKENMISKEEVELMSLLLLNLIIRVKNKEIEEQNLVRERVQLVNKMSNKFLNYQKDIFPDIKKIIESIKNNVYNIEENKNNVKRIEKKITKFENEFLILNDIIRTDKLQFKKVNINDLIKKLIADFKLEADSYCIDISLLSNFDTNIFGDEKMLYHMFLELIKNSIDSILVRNKIDKKINIIISEDDNKRLIIEIIDNGIGMTNEDVKALNNAYSSSLERNILGFGLTTVYKIVREHKGVINISSILDEGTKIKIIFNVYKEEI